MIFWFAAFAYGTNPKEGVCRTKRGREMSASPCEEARHGLLKIHGMSVARLLLADHNVNWIGAKEGDRPLGNIRKQSMEHQ